MLGHHLMLRAGCVVADGLRVGAVLGPRRVTAAAFRSPCKHWLLTSDEDPVYTTILWNACIRNVLNLQLEFSTKSSNTQQGVLLGQLPMLECWEKGHADKTFLDDKQGQNVLQKGTHCTSAVATSRACQNTAPTYAPGSW